MATDKKQRGRPARFTHQEIVSAAAELVRKDGPEALTIRSVADYVGTSRMTMYTYFEDKAHLEYDVATELLSALKVRLPRSGDWRSTTKAWLIGLRREMLALGGLISLLEKADYSLPFLPGTARVASCLVGEGLPASLAAEIAHGATLMAAGFARNELTRERLGVPKTGSGLDAALERDHPELVPSLLPEISRSDLRTSFDSISEMLLDGIELRIARHRRQGRR